MMKKIFFIALTLILAASCQRAGRQINENIVPGSGLYLPVNDAYYDLSAGKAVSFEWGPAMAEDNGYVSYEVLFDRPGGDFSSPVGRVAGQINGSRNYVTVPAKTLSKIARQSGIGIYAEGTLQWTVRASKGVGGVVYPGARKVMVRTMNSMDPLPVTVGVSGTAVEDSYNMAPSRGIDKSGAPEGVYELFGRIAGGSAFQIKDNLDRYYVLNADGTMRAASTATDTQISGGNDIRWIQLDFSSMTWWVKSVAKVEYYAAAWTGTMITDRRQMTYDGKGVWKLLDYPNTVSLNEAGDTRHRFDMTLADQSIVYLGTEAPLGTDYTTDYMRVFLYTDETIGSKDWDKTYNYLPADAGRKLDIFLYMNADNPSGSWWHEYNFK